MIERVLEPEVMDDSEEADSYDRMDHSQVNRCFVDDLLAAGPLGRDVLDLGTGTALIPIELCQRQSECRVMASDAAVSMLDLARYHIAVASLEQRIQLHHGDSKALGFDDAMFDTVMSNSLTHHIPEPKQVFAEMVRVCKPGGRLFVRDLCRPNSLAELEALVATYASHESASSQQLLRQSLHAALSLDDVQKLLQQLGVAPETVVMSSDRHWTWSMQKP